MEKVGRQRVKVERMNLKPRKCANCGGGGEFRVTFIDRWCKLTITLCDACSRKKYEELNLQTSLNWPGSA